MDWKLEVVVVPVTDVDQAKQFYRDRVGFAVDHDIDVGAGVRFVQLTPPGSACSIVLTRTVDGSPSGTMQGLQLVVSDIEAARTELVDRGLDVSAVQHFDNGVRVDGRGGAWNSFVFFSDPDGNGWTVQEAPARD